MAANHSAPLLAVEASLRLEHGERVIDCAALGELPLRGPVIEDDPELGEIAADVGEHIVASRQLQHPPEAVRADQLARTLDQGIDVGFLVAGGSIRREVREHQGGRAAQLLCGGGPELLRQRPHVLAAITVLGKGQLLAAELEVSHPGAHGKDVHLPPGIVDVVLTLDVKARRSEDVGERRPVRCLASVADVQRAGGIGGDELQEYPLACAQPALAVGCALFVNAAELARVGLGGEMKVDEAGSCHLGARHERTVRQCRDDGCGELTRLAAASPGEAQREIGSEITVPRLARALHYHLGRRGYVRQHASPEPGKGGEQQLLEVLLHAVELSLAGRRG